MTTRRSNSIDRLTRVVRNDVCSRPLLTDRIGQRPGPTTVRLLRERGKCGSNVMIAVAGGGFKPEFWGVAGVIRAGK